MKYPKTFPEHLNKHVDGAIAEAEIEFLEAKKKGPYCEIDKVIYAYVLRVFAAFGEQSCRAFEDGHWNGETLRAEMDRFLEHLIDCAYFEKHFQRDNYAFNKFLERTKEAMKQSDEWKRIQSEIKRIADRSPAFDGDAALADPRRKEFDISYNSPQNIPKGAMSNSPRAVETQNDARRAVLGYWRRKVVALA